MLYLFGTNIRDHELLALSKRFHFLDVDLGFCIELASHGLCSFFEQQPCLGAIGAHTWKRRKEEGVLNSVSYGDAGFSDNLVL